MHRPPAPAPGQDCSSRPTSHSLTNWNLWCDHGCSGVKGGWGVGGGRVECSRQRGKTLHGWLSPINQQLKQASPAPNPELSLQAAHRHCIYSTGRLGPQPGQQAPYWLINSRHSTGTPAMSALHEDSIQKQALIKCFFCFFKAHRLIT